MIAARQYLPDGVPGRCWLRSDRRFFESAPRRHRELVALFAITGRMRYLIADRILTLGPGALLWAHTDHPHFLLSETRDFDMWVLVVAPWVLKPARLFPPRLGAATGLGPEARLLGDDAAAELGAVAATLRGTSDPALVAAGLRWWMARAWSAWQAADLAAGQRVHPAVQRASHIMRADPEVSLLEVARRAGISLSRLRRVFRANVGLGLSQFRTARRLEQVDAALARSPAPSLLVAALDSGFGSYTQFYRACRAVRGMGPREYYGGGGDAAELPVKTAPPPRSTSGRPRRSR
jgi:AraC-like DNA-binding protein